MYANVRNARMRCGESTSSAIWGSRAGSGVDDVADRLVDEGNPDLFRVGHAPKDGSLARARQPSWAATSRIRAAKRRRKVFGQRQCGQGAPERRGWRRPITIAARQRTLPYWRWRYVPARAVGMIAASEVASAST